MIGSPLTSGKPGFYWTSNWIKPGVDFIQVITEAIARSRVLLVIIGPQRLASDGDGRLRLDKPDDPVRVEIETAFRREIRVIPLVVDGATMPRAGDLPDALAGLARLNALPVGYQSSRSDVSMGSGDHLRVCLLVSTCVVVTWSPGSQWEGHPRRCRMTR